MAVVHRILEQPSRITDIHGFENEFYFKYQNYSFSILRRLKHGEDDSEYTFCAYPRTNLSSAELAREFAAGDSEGTVYAAYHSKDLGENCEHVMARLYQMMQSKVLGVDDMLDDILRNT